MPLMPLIDRGGEITAVLPASVRITSGRDMSHYYPMEKVEKKNSGARASWFEKALRCSYTTREWIGACLPTAAPRHHHPYPHKGPIVHSRRVSPESLFLFDTNDPAPCNVDA